MWDEWDNHNYLQRQQQQQQPQPQQQTAEEAESTSSESEEQQQQEEKQSHLNFDFLSVLAKPKDYYRILEVDYDATEEAIRSNYIRLALKWHPDKQKDQDCATSIFQEINEAYQVLSDPVKRQEYDQNGMLRAYDYNIVEYLNRYKGLILTCNGLGMECSMW
ncbi:uncharacterized protein LOC113750874 [Coffea eugenioides]|uniref:uncharacterized protein LOC113750874 n=1 Tax=Coffea eugenioides TaxID=49369 RepID=UPI000F612CF5|nr:uncharacterized protein LOC113750874 [Coffea eugenioides]